jgi:hypothetical protein
MSESRSSSGPIGQIQNIADQATALVGAIEAVGSDAGAVFSHIREQQSRQRTIIWLVVIGFVVQTAMAALAFKDLRDIHEASKQGRAYLKAAPRGGDDEVFCLTHDAFLIMRNAPPSKPR